MTTEIFNNTKLKNKIRRHNKPAYRSGLEEHNAAFLEASGVYPVEYEQYTVSYRVPERETKYTPDFVLPNGVIVETKGRFMPDDRQKHILIKAQHPDLDIRFVFTNSRARLYKGSPTSYAQWCQKFGFKYTDRCIPVEWLKEAPMQKVLIAVKTLLKNKTTSKKEVKPNNG